MSWQNPVRRSDEGEVGRVYYLNTRLVWKLGEEWTRNIHFTLNPEFGSTIEAMIKRSKEIPHPMKADLLSKRLAEAKLSSGHVLTLWISEDPAPEYWEPTDSQKIQKAKQTDRPVLFGADGRVL